MGWVVDRARYYFHFKVPNEKPVQCKEYSLQEYMSCLNQTMIEEFGSKMNCSYTPWPHYPMTAEEQSVPCNNSPAYDVFYEATKKLPQCTLPCTRTYYDAKLYPVRIPLGDAR